MRDKRKGICEEWEGYGEMEMKEKREKMREKMRGKEREEERRGKEREEG